MPARRGRPRRAPARALARTSRAEAAWREFAASFTRIGMVPPAEPGLVAVEAAEGTAVLLLAPRQVSSARSVPVPPRPAPPDRLLCPAGADLHRQVPPALPLRCRPPAGLRRGLAPPGTAGLLAGHALRAQPGGAARRPPARRRAPPAARRRPRRHALAPRPSP